MQTTDEVGINLTGSEFFEKIRQFINQRPGLDFANYGDRKSFMSELRSIQCDRQRALKALAAAQLYPFNAALMADSLGRSFSGRLSWDGKRFDYCTGQYWPTEYRKAAASVLETYAEAVRPKFPPEPGAKFSTMAQIKAASHAAGSHWFDKSTLGFFRCRILPTVYNGPGGIFFISSEEGPSEVRAYTVRKFNPVDADIKTVGKFNELSRSEAIALAKRSASEEVKA